MSRKLFTMPYLRFFNIFILLVSTTLIAKPVMAKHDKAVIKVYTDSVATHDYFKKIIELALAKIKEPEQYKIKYINERLSQGRIIRELARKHGAIDLYPTGTSQEREDSLIPIKIPLFKGTLGYRIPIIHKDNFDNFKKIKTREDLQKYIACQGEHWPDSDILEHAGLRVVRNYDYKSMFTQTIKKYCDYFPRAIIEGYTELEAHNLTDTDLIVFDQLLIMYTFPMYFFVSPDNKEFAADLKKGLYTAIEDGSFNEYFESNATTKDLYPLSKWNSVVKIRLDNPFLPVGSPVDNNKLWLSLE